MIFPSRAAFAFWWLLLALPAMAGRFDWVDLERLNAGFVFDLRYATRNNFTGKVLYPKPGAFLRREPAMALAAVQRDLARRGLGLKIYDAYRPLPVQQLMWDLIRDERYVSNPAVNAGRHTRGAAVDVTLVDARGRELPMPTGYDDFTEKAAADARGVPRETRRNRALLRKAMERRGFAVYPTEWWHFDYREWQGYPPERVSIETLKNREGNRPAGRRAPKPERAQGTRTGR